MTDERFESLVRKFEAQARSDPQRYKSRVVLLALLGQAYLGAVLLLLLALVVALMAAVVWAKLLALKLLILVGAFLWMVVRALWVRLEPPGGTAIVAAQAPELFAMIADLQQALKAPRFHRVLVTAEVNAGVAQFPRLGIFGWPRNYLLIGLPLMKSLKVEQFKAVLAHEFGHLALGHGATANWIYRQRLRWSRLLRVLEHSRSRASFLFKPFLKWFAPYFNAYSFPMARANEYEADAASARLTSARVAAEALTTVEVAGAYLAERYWPRIYQLADDQPHPSVLPYQGIERGIAVDVDDQSGQAWLSRALSQQASLADTHPPLKDRIAALGESPHFAPPAVGEGADRLLGGALDAVTEAFDRRWRDEVAASWQKRYEEVQHNRRRLSELNAQISNGTELTVAEAVNRARLTELVGHDTEGALAQFRTLYDRAPDDAAVCIGLGARLLWRNDATGCALVERAIELDRNTTGPACELLRDFCRRSGKKDEAHGWQQRLVEWSQGRAAVR